MDLRQGEASSALFLFLYFFLVITFQYACKSVRQAELIDRLGAEALPLVYFLVALASLPILAVYSRFCERLPRHHLIAATSLLVAGSVLGFWWIFETEAGWAPVAFYVWISIVFVLNVSQFWSYANHVFDARQAKRLFGVVGAGGLLGGVAGGQVTAIATRWVGARFSLVVAAAILVATAALIYVIHAARGRGAAPDAGVAGMARLDEARGGFKVIRESRHLRLVTATMIVTVVVAQIVDVQFSSAVERSTTTLEERAAVFGNFYSVMGISAFAFQFLFTARIHRLFGIGAALRVLPVTLAAGTVGVLLAAAGFPALLLPAALGLKVAENGIRYSLDQTTRELLFMPIPSRSRLKAKATIDVFVQRFGKGIAAVILLPVVVGWVPAIQVGWISLGFIAVWLGIAAAMHRQYVETFRAGLRRATVDRVSPIDLQDAKTIEILVQSLGSDEPRQVLLALDLLRYHDKGGLVPRWLLHHDDPEVRRRTLQVLAESGGREAVPLVERAMGDGDVGVRVEAARALAAILGDDAAEAMVEKLDDPDPRIRSAAIAAVAGGGDKTRLALAARALDGLLADGDPEVRAEAAGALAALPDPVLEDPLVRLLQDRDRRVLRAAIRAAGRRMEAGRFNPLYPPLLVSRLRDRRLKHDAREALVSCGPEVIPALVHFMEDRDEDLWVRRAIPKTLARIGGPEAARALLAAAGSADRFLRRKAVEALAETVAPAEIGAARALLEARLLEESRGYLRALADLSALSEGEVRLVGPLVARGSPFPTLLHDLLADRMRGHVDQVFGLLALLHPRRDIEAARRGLLGADSGTRSHAIEYLDNALGGETGRTVMIALGDWPWRARLEKARRAFGIEPGNRDAVLRRLLATPLDGCGDDAWLVGATLEATHALRAELVYPMVRESAARATDPLVRETAVRVAARIDAKG